MQRMNAQVPILVTLLGMVIEVKPEQSSKAQLPILVTLLGIVMEVRSVQSSKARKPILVTLLGMVVFIHPYSSVLLDVSIIALQLFRESKFGLPASTMMEVKPEQ